MRTCPFLIAFFSISLSCHSSDVLQECVRSSAGSCLIYDQGAESVSIAEREDKSLHLTIGNHYLTKELSHYRLETVLPSSFLVFAANMEWFGYELYNNLSLRTAIGKRISGSWSLGINLTLKSIYYEGLLRRETFLICDLFAKYHNESPHEFYTKAENLFGAGLRSATDQFISEGRGFTIGWLTHFSEHVSCAMETRWNTLESWRIHFGAEYDMGKFILRCGASGPPIIPSFGVGFVQKNFSLDFAARWTRNLGYVLDCGISHLF